MLNPIHGRSTIPRFMIALLFWAFALQNLVTAFPLDASTSLYDFPGPDDPNQSPWAYLNTNTTRQKRSNNLVSRNLSPVPGVDEISEKVKEFGKAQTMRDVFFTGYPFSAPEARKRGKELFDESGSGPGKPADWKFCLWGRFLDQVWVAEVSTSYKDDMEDAGFSEESIQVYRQIFLKNMAQAYAENSQGDVLLIASEERFPEDDQWDVDTAWGGWEYGALTRNPNVRTISRIDVEGDCDEKLMWSQGDPAWHQEPKGTRKTIIPVKE